MKTKKLTMLTTIDNPFDPFEEFDDWFAFDTQNGYNTCGYIDRIANIADSMTDYEKDLETERAINEILEYNFTGLYKKVEKEE